MICIGCRSEFYPDHHSQKYCNRTCQNKYAKRREYVAKRDNNRCLQCGGPKDSEQTRCSQCRAYRSANAMKIARARKKKFIEVYGGKCDCCSETMWEFLSIDHVRGDGREDRHVNRNILYKRAVENYDLKKYRVLCMNCNTAIGFYGYCPHQRGK